MQHGGGVQSLPDPVRLPHGQQPDPAPDAANAAARQYTTSLEQFEQYPREYQHQQPLQQSRPTVTGFPRQRL